MLGSFYNNKCNLFQVGHNNVIMNLRKVLPRMTEKNSNLESDWKIYDKCRKNLPQLEIKLQKKKLQMMVKKLFMMK